ncbi:MAG: hypothetical protein ACKVGV_01960 [Sphingomonadales bacterium]|jgi:hypothetical protein
MSRIRKTPSEGSRTGLTNLDAFLLGASVLAILLLVSSMSVDAAAFLGGLVLLFAVHRLIVGPKS